MKRLIMYAVLLSFTVTSCNGQKKLDKTIVSNDTIKPKTNISVHKEYDENGNLISVDSTYTYFYSNIKNDSALEKEIFDRFKLNFNDHFEPIDSIFMDNFFENTPFNLNDFYTDDFFQQNFKNHQQKLEQIFKEMDSLKNSYYREQKELMKKKS